MKSKLFHLLVAAVVLLSCNNNDPVKEAKEDNKEKIDSQSSAKDHDATQNMEPTKSDADFLVEAASGGMMEVQLGDLAGKNTANRRVKNFGAMMSRDHKMINEKLKTVAAGKNITLPDSISNKQQKDKEKLSKERGNDFDMDYMMMMIGDHKNDIKAFEKAATSGTNPAVKSFAADQLKILHVHLDSAVSIYKYLNPSDTSSRYMMME